MKIFLVNQLKKSNGSIVFSKSQRTFLIFKNFTSLELNKAYIFRNWKCFLDKLTIIGVFQAQKKNSKPSLTLLIEFE